jgi:hypothetical protein
MVCAGCGAEFNGTEELCAACRRLTDAGPPPGAAGGRPFVVSRPAGQPDGRAGGPAPSRADEERAATGRAVRVVLVGGIALVVVAVGVLTFTFRERPRRPAVVPGGAADVLLARRAGPASSPASRPSDVELAPTCDGAPCQAVPRGLKKWQFGMTVADAKAQPDKATSIAPVTVGTSPAAKGAKGARAASSVPAQRLQARTTLAGQPATCVLVFAVQERLSQVTCRLSSQRGVGDHRDLETVVLKALRGRYGAERRHWPHKLLADQRASEPRAQVGTHNVRIYRAYQALEHLGRWAWWDDAARLELVSEYERVGRRRASSLLEVRNTSAAHEELLGKLQAATPDASDL